MEQFNRLISEIERDLNAERCITALPGLIAYAKGNSSLLTRVYILAARSFFVARDFPRYKEMLERAQDSASKGSIEDKVKVSGAEASLLTSSADIVGSNAALSYALHHLAEVSDEVRAQVLSVYARNCAMSGQYSEAVEISQQVLELGDELSASSAFANGTISFVFANMGRLEESEQFGLEQIRILMARGAGNWVGGLYSFLSASAASVQQWEKAQEYALKADEARGLATSQANRTISVFWELNAQIELGHVERATELAQEALLLAASDSSDAHRMNAHILHARTLYLGGHYEEALTALQIPLEQHGAIGDSLNLELDKWLAKTYQALGRKAEAFDICYRLWERQTDFDNRTRDALLSYHRALERKVHDQKVSIMNLKTAQMERELAMTATQLVAQTDLLGRFRNDLREIVRESRSDDPAMKKVKEKLKTLPCESIDWTRFEAQFSTVHPEFKSKLEEKHPDLTRSEVKICALSRMKLTSEEIGRLLCLSDRTVQAHRFNIRKKLGLKTEDNLATYLAGI